MLVGTGGCEELLLLSLFPIGKRWKLKMHEPYSGEAQAKGSKDRRLISTVLLGDD